MRKSSALREWTPGSTCTLRKSSSKETRNLLPQWLRFVKGRWTARTSPCKFPERDPGLCPNQKDWERSDPSDPSHAEGRSRQKPRAVQDIFEEFGHFIKEGAVTDFERRDDVSKLLRLRPPQAYQKCPRTITSSNAVEQEKIYSLQPTRELALASPYYEEFKREKVEVLFLYELIDEFVMSNVAEYQGRKFVSAELVD